MASSTYLSNPVLTINAVDLTAVSVAVTSSIASLNRSVYDIRQPLDVGCQAAA